MKSDKCDSHRVYVDAVNDVIYGTQSILSTSVIVGISNRRLFVSVREGCARVLLNVAKRVQIREVFDKGPKEAKSGNIRPTKANEATPRVTAQGYNTAQILFTRARPPIDSVR